MTQGLTARIAQSNVIYNRQRGTLRGHALPGCRRTRRQDLPGDARRDLRRDRRPPAGVGDLRALGVVPAAADVPRDALRARALRPGLPDARGRHRGGLPDVGALRARSTSAASATTTRRSGSTWPLRGARSSPRRTGAGRTSSRRRPLEASSVIIVDRELAAARRPASPSASGWWAPARWAAGSRCSSSARCRGMELTAISNRSPEAAEAAYRQAGADDVALRRRSSAELERAARAGTSRRSPTTHRRLRARRDRRGARGHRHGRVRRRGRARRDRARQARRDDERRAPGHARAAAQGARRPGGRRAHRLGRRPARRDHEPVPLRRGHRRPAGAGGNLKGLHDPYRNPTTQEGFAAARACRRTWRPRSPTARRSRSRWRIVANATGLRVAQRGMHGPERRAACTRPSTCSRSTSCSSSRSSTTSSARSPRRACSCSATRSTRSRRPTSTSTSSATGPLYVFYRPYHLCHFEVPSTLARAVLFGDATIAPLERAPCRGGDGRQARPARRRGARRHRLLHDLRARPRTPSVAARARTAADGPRRGLPADARRREGRGAHYADVEVPAGRLGDRLCAEQQSLWRAPAA